MTLVYSLDLSTKQPLARAVNTEQQDVCIFSWHDVKTSYILRLDQTFQRPKDILCIICHTLLSYLPGLRTCSQFEEHYLICIIIHCTSLVVIATLNLL